MALKGLVCQIHQSKIHNGNCHIVSGSATCTFPAVAGAEGCVSCFTDDGALVTNGHLMIPHTCTGPVTPDTRPATTHTGIHNGIHPNCQAEGSDLQFENDPLDICFTHDSLNGIMDNGECSTTCFGDI